ncbi:MAG TPA: hypothetical protein PKC65_14120 [Pyrinomonadaceae bacterium]|nr:hypothetical protein [Pyrinomonadaceae bacterium]
MKGLIIQKASLNDAKLLAALAYTTFWDAGRNRAVAAPLDPQAKRACGQ